MRITPIRATTPQAVTKTNTRLFAEKVMPKVKDLFGEWEDKWWPQPMAQSARAEVPAYRPSAAAE